MRYFFILGRNPELSLAELNAVLPLGSKPIAISRTVFIAECEELEVDALMRRLGGVVKMGEIISIPKAVIAPAAMSESAPLIFDAITRTAPNDKKIFFGLSAYSLDDEVRLPNLRQLREMGINIKHLLKERQYKARLVTAKEATLSSVIVQKEKLLSQGAEIVLFYDKGSISIGRTLAVQEFEEASMRDFGRPVREMRVGILPIQLAKIMINLARAPLSATLLDPFCGFGTILSEAMLMDYKHLIGSDLESRMVEATQENLEWLTQKSRIQNPNLNLFQSPAEEISKYLSPHSVDTIVTEPYMGPTRRVSGVSDQVSGLSELYVSVFREFAKILKPKGRVVFIFPAFRYAGRLSKTSDYVLPEIKKLGFNPTQLLSQQITTPYSLPPTYSITYSRPDQHVLREIYVFRFEGQAKEKI